MKIWILPPFRKYFHAYIFAIVGFLVSIGLFYALQYQEEQHILSIARLGIESIANDVRSELSFNAHVLSQFAAEKDADPKTFLQNNTQFYALAEASAPLTLHWFSSPGMISQEAFEKSLRNLKPTLNASVWVSSLTALGNGKKAFFMIIRLKNAAESRYLIALVDSYSLLNQTIHLPGMVLDLYDNHEPINAAKSEENLPWVLEVSQNLYGALWEIKARESSNYWSIFHFIQDETSLAWVTLLLGIGLSLLLARSVALSDLLKEKTITLHKINQDLKHEITEHIQTEESKKNLEKALLQSQKLQAIGTLAGGIAHDFNNILYAIRGYVELARDDLPPEGIVYKNLGKVLEGTHRGQDLVARILSFSRRQHYELSPLSLRTEITGALGLLRPTIPESVDIHFTCVCDCKILGNKTQIHQIMVNLINNAVDAMDSEGAITITLDKVTSDELNKHQFSTMHGSSYCRIRISDTGNGMDFHTLERIFDPFFTTKEVGKGTGLGLSTVHAITKEYNGEIMVNSQLGQGTTFTLFFPTLSEGGLQDG